MKTPENDTISAIITPIGTGGIAVLRISGPESIRIANENFQGSASLSTAQSHTVHFGRIEDNNGSVLDEVLVTIFRAPHSYTTEDVVEISCHGSVFVARKILDVLVAKGARPAGPGEFTKRAFLNGRIDLSQAEAVADLISADSRASHELALAQLRGTLSGKITVLRQRILDLCSTLELELDFSEEGMEFIGRDSLREEVRKISLDITQLVDSFELGKVYKEGIRVVLAGAPNVGKSSILNALVREDRAIVTEISGTTRDTIEETISIGGIKFNIIDTAGLRSTDDVIEAEGIKRTRQQIEFADLILLVVDPTQDIHIQEDVDFVRRLIGSEKPKDVIIVINKADISSPENIEDLKKGFSTFPVVVVSVNTGLGIAELERKISDRVGRSPKEIRGESIIVSNLRQKESLAQALKSLEMVLHGVDRGATPDLLAVDLRSSLTRLSHVVGVDISEEVLNNVFLRFCIGK